MTVWYPQRAEFGLGRSNRLFFLVIVFLNFTFSVANSAPNESMEASNASTVLSNNNNETLGGTSQIQNFEKKHEGKWGVSYFNMGGNQLKVVQDGGAGLSAYNYMSLNYKTGSDETYSLRPIFFVNTAGYNKYGENKGMDVTAGDIFINYANYKIAEWESGWKFWAQTRFFLPVSEESKKQKVLTHFYSELVLEKEINRNWDFSYHAKPDLFWQTQKSYRNEYDKYFADGGSTHIIEAKNNRLATLDHFVEVSRYFNKYLTPYLALGFSHEWYYTSDQTTKGDPVVNKLKITPGTKLFTIKGLWFMLYAENEIGIDRTQMSFKDGTLSWTRDKYGDGKNETITMFRPEDTTLGFRTFWTIW